MAKENKSGLNILTPETRRQLEAFGKQIEDSEKKLVLLEKLGVGVGDLRARLQWAKTRREILLKEG